MTVERAHPSRALGLLVAAASVAATTAIIYPLRQVMPSVSTGVLYLIGVLIVSTRWGLWLGLVTSVASAAAFNFFHIPPTGRFTVADAQNWVALAVYFAAAVVTSTLAGQARDRAIEADQRRTEADLSADLARLVLGGTESELPEAGHRIGAAIGLADVRLVLDWVDGDERRIALPLVEDGERVGTLLVPREISDRQREQLESRVAPSLTALMAAARRRALLEEQLVETRALRRSDVLKTALLRAVSHDLRSPITAIRTAAAGIASQTVGQEDRAEMASVISTETERLARLVDDLLDLSRLEAGTADPRRQWSSIEEVVDAAGHGLSGIDVQLDPDLPLVQVDSAQLERAIGNLLQNAVRYSDGQPVSVRGHVSGRRLLLRISDHGPGIPKEELERIFEPFYQVNGGSHSGSGLGLAIARGFVEANGGRLRAQSLPGQGSTFVIELPI
jgi:two-component system, OmpR family, sensor histidine kinase KdpD